MAEGIVSVTRALVSPASSGSFQDVDVSALVPTGAEGVILEVINDGDPVKFEYYTAGDDANRGSFGNTWSSQTFTVQAGQPHRIRKVVLKLFRVGLPGTVTVSIKATDGSGHPTGADKCVTTINGNVLTDVSPGQYYDVDFGTGLSHDAQLLVTKYAIVIRALAGDASNTVIWRRNSAGTYTGGNLENSTDGGVTWTSATATDMMFEEWGLGNQSWGVRKNGSADTAIYKSIHPESHTWAAIGLDANRVFEANVTSASLVKIYLIGYVPDGAGAFLDSAVNKSPATGSWLDVDISADTGADTAKIAFLFVKNTTLGHKDYGLREKGSTDNRIGDVGNFHLLGAFIPVDSVEKFQAYIAHADIQIYLIGWLKVGYAESWADAKDYSTPTVGSWVTTALADLPSGIKGAFLHIWNTTQDAEQLYRMGLRKDGETYENCYFTICHEFVWCEVDALKELQQKISSAVMDLYLLGYSKALAYECSCTDGLLAGDSPATQCSFGVSVTDGLKPGDTPASIGIFSNLLADGLKLGDLAVYAELYQLLASDGFMLGDARGAIDAGLAATNRYSGLTPGETYLAVDNPANLSGVITTVELWAHADMSNVKVGVFYLVSGTTYKCRDSITLGGVSIGYHKYSVSLGVQAGDYIGAYYSAGAISLNTTGGSGLYHVSGEYADPEDEATYALAGGYRISLYGSALATPTGQLTTYPGASDGIKAGDSPSTLATLVALAQDGIKLSDATAMGLVYQLLIADGVKLSDTDVANIICNLMVTDGLKLGDAIKCLLIGLRKARLILALHSLARIGVKTQSPGRMTVGIHGWE